MNRIKRLALLALPLALALFVPTPVAAAPAVERPAAVAAAPDFRYLDCGGSGTRWFYLTSARNCEDPSRGALGFASLTREINSHNQSVHVLEICNYAPLQFSALINVANADGSATDRVIEYWDTSAGGCFFRTLGYPIRKWRIAYPGYSASYWAPLPD